MGLTRLQASTITDSDFKTSCKVATQANITNLTTGAPNTVDGQNLSVGDRVLVRAQDNAAENGIYTVVSVGTGSNGRWARAVDFKDNVSISSGSIAFVEYGTSANIFYYLAGGIGTVTVGSTNLNFRSFTLSPPGSNTQVVFNNNGEYGASSSLTWNGANLSITGNILANAYYFSNGSPFTSDSTQILNGNSNVIVAANANVTVSVAGNANVVTFTGTGANINGTANVTGNANVGNLGATTVVASDLTGNLTTAAQPNITSLGTLSSLSVTGNTSSGNLNTAGKVVGSVLESNVTTGTAPLTVISTTQVANLNAATAGHSVTANTVVDASQPNITSVGTLGSLIVSGNANVGNILAGGFYFANGSPFTVDTTQILNGNSNVVVSANSNVTVSVAGNANVLVVTSTGANIVGTVNITGNANVGNIGGTAAIFTDLTGNLTTAAQPNITSVGTLTSLSVTGNVSAANLVATGDLYLSGNDIRSSTGNIAISLSDKDVTVVGNLAVQGLTTTIGSQNYSVQDSIIDLHTFPNLAPLTADDGRDIGIRMHYFKSTTDKHAFLGWANDTSFLEYYSDATESSGVISGTYGTAKVANVYVTDGVVYNGNSNVTITANSNVSIFVNGNATARAVFTSTGANLAGTLDVTGNVTVSNITANGTANLGSVSNVKITGGSANQYLKTDGAGNLSFAAAGGANFTASATAPSSPSVGDYWYDTSSDILYIRINDGSSDIWIDVTTIPRVPVYSTAATAPTNSIPGDYWYDTDTDILYLRINDGTSDIWLDISTDLTARLTASATTPASSATGDLWYDTSTDIIFQYINDGTSNVWVDISSTGNTFNTITAITANLTTINGTNVNVTGTNGTVTANTHVATGARTGNANVSTVQSNFGGFRAVSSTYTDNIATGGATIANAAVHALGTPTVAAANASVTMTNAATFYIQDAPAAGANVTLNNSYALHVAAGNSAFGGNILTTANAIYDIGSTTNQFNAVYATTFTGTATTALYADLAENYKADSRYEKGSVVVFGGAAEITATTISHDARVAGVISTAPAYLMNNANVGDDWLPVALTGRVPCFVRGPVKKGDVLVTSNQPGVAEKLDKSKYEPGCVIGKALEDHTENTVKTIEVVVGRF